MLSIKQLESATKADKSKFLHTSALSVILLKYLPVKSILVTDYRYNRVGN